MISTPRILKIALVGSWSPKPCGIATYGRDLKQALEENENVFVDVYAVHEDRSVKRKYPEVVKRVIQHDDPADYLRAAQAINEGGYDLVCLQHEYSLYGRPFGQNVFQLVERLRIPLITTFHTVPVDTRAAKRRSRLAALWRITNLSSAVVVTSAQSAQVLIKELDFPATKVNVIHHGTPEIPRLSNELKKELRRQLGMPDGQILLTFGLIRNTKGIEYAIKAVERLVARYSDLRYFVVGTSLESRPGYRRYHQDLKNYVNRNRLQKHLYFVDKYLTDEDLIKYVQASDMLITPYLEIEQVSSGVLAWGMAAGKVIVSTPYWYAREVLKPGRGIFIRGRSVQSIVAALDFVLTNPAVSNIMAGRAAKFGQQMTWRKTGQEYLRLVRRTV